MSERSLSSLLDRLAPAVEPEEPAWEDVLARAGTSAPRPARHRPVVLALAATVFAAVVAAALAAGGLHRFSAWVSGEPGTPAPRADELGFAHRNAAAFARFPSGTKLRLLAAERAGGETFNLLGFRDGDSLCLRVVRADLPGARGTLQCADLPELEQSPAPAVVVDDPEFAFGDPAQVASGVYGFADDTVQRIEIVRERTGTQTVVVRSNAFLGLLARPAGTVAKPPPQDPITGVFAVRNDGSRVRLAYLSAAAATQSAPAKPPFYLAAPRVRPAQLPGPSRVTRTLPLGTVGWVLRREPRGEPFTLPARYERHFGRVLFARAIRPDPARPDRIAVMLVRLEHEAFGPGTSTRPVVCFSPLQPLGALGGMSCFGRNGRFRVGDTYMWPSQIAHVAGLVEDGVAAVKFFLANGRVIPAPVVDNAFVADVPQTVASKRVAYDAQGHVVDVQMLGSGPMRYTTCPAVAVPATIPPARPYERIDLGAATLNGQPILGRTVAQVVAALGPPARTLHNTVENGVRIPDLLYGSADQRTATTQIQFGKQGSRIVAVAMSFSTPRLVDARLGHVLAQQPGAVQRAIERTYPSYRLTAGYGTLDAHGCNARFTRGRQGTHVGLGFGNYPALPGHRSQAFLSLRRGY